MTAPSRAVVTAAVEGDLDEVVLRRVAEEAGLAVERVHGRKGKPALLEALSGHDRAARLWPWIVLVDLDRDCGCAPSCRRKWLSDPAASMRFRIAVGAIEAWILADRERVSGFLGISLAAAPSDPDGLENPKETLVSLARRSRRRAVREDLLPTPGGGRRIGPLYTARMSAFVDGSDAGWRPGVAARRSDSLARCLRRLRELSGA